MSRSALLATNEIPTTTTMTAERRFLHGLMPTNHRSSETLPMVVQSAPNRTANKSMVQTNQRLKRNLRDKRRSTGIRPIDVSLASTSTEVWDSFFSRNDWSRCWDHCEETANRFARPVRITIYVNSRTLDRRQGFLSLSYWRLSRSAETERGRGVCSFILLSIIFMQGLDEWRWARRGWRQ
jgi:hypothetical protein